IMWQLTAIDYSRKDISVIDISDDEVVTFDVDVEDYDNFIDDEVAVDKTTHDEYNHDEDAVDKTTHDEATDDDLDI
nr:hypothetical protein [Tanacetum cinerariifolium]